MIEHRPWLYFGPDWSTGSDDRVLVVNLWPRPELSEQYELILAHLRVIARIRNPFLHYRINGKNLFGLCLPILLSFESNRKEIRRRQTNPIDVRRANLTALLNARGPQQP